MTAPQTAEGNLVLLWQLLAFNFVVHFLALDAMETLVGNRGSLIARHIAAFAESQ